MIEKIVEGVPPPSDWEFDLGLNVPPYSTTITIDKAGGETTIAFAFTQVAVSIVERTKTNYIVYASNLGIMTQTHVVFVGTGQLINQFDTVTVAFINQNTVKTPSAGPVGGFTEPVNRLQAVIMYVMIFAMISMSIGVYIINKRRPKYC